MKKNKYDYTVNDRMKSREMRIKDAGLSHLRVVMHKEDAELVRRYAEELYKKRGIEFS